MQARALTASRSGLSRVHSGPHSLVSVWGGPAAFNGHFSLR